MKEFAQNLSKREIAFIVIILTLLLVTGLYVWQLNNRKQQESISSFAECVAAGNPIMESYPEQCAANGKTYANPDQILD